MQGCLAHHSLREGNFDPQFVEGAQNSQIDV